MSTHNICFCGEMRKILCGYLFLSGAMIRAYTEEALDPWLSGAPSQDSDQTGWMHSLI